MGQLLRVLALMPLLGACRSLPQAPEWGLIDADSVSPPDRESVPEYLTGVRATLRAVLTWRGMELPLTIRCYRQQGRQVHANRILVTGDLGGTLLHVVDRLDVVESIRRADTLDATVADELVADLRAWLFRTPESLTPIALHDPKVGFFVAFLDSHRQDSIHLATRTDGRLDRILRLDGAHIVAEIDIEYHGGRPSSLRLRNHRVDALYEIDVKEWAAEDFPKGWFDRR